MKLLTSKEIEVARGHLDNGTRFRLLVADAISTDEMRNVACLLYAGADKVDATSVGKTDE